MRKTIIYSLFITLICIIAIIYIINIPSKSSDNVTIKKVTNSAAPNNKSSTSSTADPSPAPTKNVYTTIVPEYGCFQIEYDVFCLINDYRKENNLKPLKWSSKLYEAACIRSKELTSNLSHTRPNGSTCFTVSNIMHSENLAYGYSTANDVVKGWINSSGHRENILNKNSTIGAISLHKTDKNYKYYWINLFGQ